MERSRNFGFLLKDVSRRYVAQFEKRASEIALTLPQCKVLVRLEKNEGVSQTRLAALAEIEPMTMVRILDRMEHDGWLERRPDPADRRARRLFLTRKARPLLDQIWRLAAATLEETFSGISKSERERFIDLLHRIHGTLCALDDASVRPGGSAGPVSARPAPRLRARGSPSRIR